MPERLFLRNPREWDSCLNMPHRLGDHAQVREIEGGIILPPVAIPGRELPYPILDIACRGGVCDPEMNCVAGHLRDPNRMPTNLDCWGAYEVGEDAIETRHEQVVFGGVLYDHFGHALIDSLTRMWYLAEHPECGKIAFLRFPYEGFLRSHFDPMLFIGLFGIPADRVEIIDAPTRFDAVIVPDEAFHCFAGHFPEFGPSLRKVAESLPPANTPKKVYLSHCAVERGLVAAGQGRHVINEEYYEGFFARRGFEVVYPEQLPLEQQVQVVHNADEIVMTIGTLSHLLLFAKQDVKATVLVRHEPMFVQANIDQAAGIEPFYVDAASNPLPIDHAHGPCLMMPNRFFRRYLDARGIAYDEGELDLDGKDELVMQFLRQWAVMYRTEGATDHTVARTTLFDVIRQMNDALYDDTFDEDAYRDADRLRNADVLCEAALREVVDMHDSTSWKLTKPLRALKDLAAGARKPSLETERTGK